MPVVELWTPRDDARATTLTRAVEAGDLAGALFAIEGAPETVVAEARAQLSSLARHVRAQLEPGDDESAQARTLARVLGAAGFQGDRVDFHAVANSHLGAVIARRRGMPILLAAVWMLVGHEAGIAVHGVALPGHFVARVGGEGGVLVDPFHGGAELDVAACQRLVRAATGHDVPWDEAFLKACATPDLIERVLRNLGRTHERDGDEIAHLRSVMLWCAVRPGSPEAWSARARLAEAVGARSEARLAYREIAARFPHSDEARRAQERLARLPETLALN